MSDVLDELRAALEAALDNHWERPECQDKSEMESMTEAFDAFAAAPPGLVDRTIHCEVCGVPGPEFPPEGWVSEWDSGEGELFMCPECVKEDQA